MAVTFDLDTPTREEKNRSVNFEWLVGTRGSKDVLAVLSVHHHKAGPNYFSGEVTTEDYFGVSLQNETFEQRGNGVTSRGFLVGKGLGLARFPAGNRFSRKKLGEAAENGLTLLRELVYEGEPRVLAYFQEGGKYGATAD